MKFSVDQYRRISMGLGHAILRLIIRTWYEHQHYPHDPHQALHHVIVSRPPHFFSPSCAPDPSVFALQWKNDDRSIVETLSDLVSTYFCFDLHNSHYFLTNKNYRFKVNKLNIFIKHNFFSYIHININNINNTLMLYLCTYKCIYGVTIGNCWN